MKNSISLMSKLVLGSAAIFLFSPQLFSQWTRSGSSVYLNNISDKVGIGTNAPVSKLDLTGGNMSINGNNILLRGGNDNNHGLGWFGTPKLFAGQSLDGPILYGWEGGALGYANNSLQKIVLRWTNSGNVGIGSFSPMQTLDVNGRIHVASGVIQRGGAAITSTADLGLYSLDNAFHMRFVTNNAPFRFFSDGGVNPTGGSELFIIGANGNVGVGTPAPVAKLHVNGSAVFSNGPGVPTTAPFIRCNSIYSTSITPDFTWWNNDQTGIFHPAPNVIAFSLSGLEVMRLHSSGCVGIGTSLTNNPNNYKLAVNGTVGAKAVKVEITSTTWADFVFEKNYQLMPLSQVEKFIITNKHLPEIPSADKMKKNGLDIGEMMKLQMQKIEELTLYVIDLQKQVDELKKENTTLKSDFPITSKK